jgi:hypothetical protein
MKVFKMFRFPKMFFVFVLCVGITFVSIVCSDVQNGEISVTGTDPNATRLTVFADDPEYGVVGMYREGSEYLFFEVKADSDRGKLETSAKFYNRNMDVIAESGLDSVAAFTAAGDKSITREQQDLVSTAAQELQKELNDDVFIPEKSVLADFQDLRGNRSVNKSELKALAARMTPATRALKTKGYIQGKQKDLKWGKDLKAGVNATAVAGTYRGTAFHSDYRIMKMRKAIRTIRISPGLNGTPVSQLQRERI